MPVPVPQPNHVNCVDALRISERERHEILAQLGRLAKQYRGVERRNHPRVEYDVPKGTAINLSHPGGSTGGYIVRPRNLGRGGMGFLHGAFVYTGTPCVLTLHTVDNEPTLVEGRIIHCRHIRGNVHDVGVGFEEPIELADFVSSCEREEPEEPEEQESPAHQLSGSVLYIEDSLTDRKMFQYLLDSDTVEVATADNGPEALELAETKLYDAILVDMWLPGMNGVEVTEAVRKRGYPGPVILVTADERAQTRQQAEEAGASDVLIKPYDAKILYELLAKYLKYAADEEDNVLMSTYWSNVRMRPLILEYLGQLENNMRRLDRAQSGEQWDYATLETVCLEIKGSSAGYGYASIGECAAQLLQLLGEQSGNAEAIQEKTQQLKQLCQSACELKRKMGNSAA